MAIEDALNPRKRPRQKRSAATVEAILEGAALVLERRGLGGYNTKEIAEAAGISVGSLYQYYPNKDSITADLILREMTKLHEALLAIDAAVAGEVRLFGIVEVAVDQQLRRHTLSRLLDSEEERLPVDGALIQVRLDLTAIVRACLVTLSPAVIDGDLVAQDVIAVIKGLVDAAGRRGEQDRPAVVDRVTRAVLGYLG